MPLWWCNVSLQTKFSKTQRVSKFSLKTLLCSCPSAKPDTKLNNCNKSGNSKIHYFLSQKPRMKIRTLIILWFLRAKWYFLGFFTHFWPLLEWPYSHSVNRIASLTLPQSSCSRFCRMLASPTHLTQSRASSRWKEPCFHWEKNKIKSRKKSFITKKSAGALTLCFCSGLSWFLNRQQQINANIQRFPAESQNQTRLAEGRIQMPEFDLGTSEMIGK